MVSNGDYNSLGRPEFCMDIPQQQSDLMKLWSLRPLTKVCFYVLRLSRLCTSILDNLHVAIWVLQPMARHVITSFTSWHNGSHSVCARRRSRRGRACEVVSDNLFPHKEWTYAGTPTAMAKHARIVSPFPYPSALYIAGAKSGKQKPAIERKKARAASAAIALVSVVRSLTRRLRLT